MTDLRINKDTLLQYDANEDKVYLNGKETKSWYAVFVPNGQDEPTFFGFTDNKKCYSIYGTVSDVHNEDSITL